MPRSYGSYPPFVDTYDYIHGRVLVGDKDEDYRRREASEALAKVTAARLVDELKAKIKSILECHTIVSKGEYNTYNLKLDILDIPTIVAEFNSDNSNTNVAKLYFKDKLITNISIDLSEKRLKVKPSDNWLRLLQILDIEHKYESYTNLEDLQFIIDWVEESRLSMCEYFL